MNNKKLQNYEYPTMFCLRRKYKRIKTVSLTVHDVLEALTKVTGRIQRFVVYNMAKITAIFAISGIKSIYFCKFARRNCREI